MRVIDAHQHFWLLGNPGHDWPTPAEAPIYRDYAPADLKAAATGVDLIGTVLIQAQPSDYDTDWLLALAAEEPLVKGVVGWVDLAAADAPARIAALAANPLLKGLRPMLQGMADTDWLLRPEVAPALAAMAEHGLRLDALIQPRHLSMLARFVKVWPNLPVVIDHAAKPHIPQGGLDPWRDDIAALADLGCTCKLSGLRTEQAAGDPAHALIPYVDHLVARFGARLMWGSDWPVIGLVGESWREWLDLSRDLVRDADAERLFAGSAVEFYDLSV